MFILRDLLQPLQSCFPDNNSGRERGIWFVYTLICVTIHFTSARTSNLLRAMETLFGFNIGTRRFYAFMDSPKLPWTQMWIKLWSSMLASHETNERVLLALDDFINPKTGKKIFGCASVFDHAAKTNQSSYPWAQNIVLVGMLKQIKGRWACLPMAFRYYHMQKTIDAEMVKIKGKVPTFQTKLAQAVEMLCEISKTLPGRAILVIADSWFGNNGLLKPLRQALGETAHLLSRMRSNAILYELPAQPTGKNAGRPRKYGKKAGSVSSLAADFRDLAQTYSVNLYGKQRDILAHSQIMMLKTLQCSVRVVWVYRKTQWVALFTTDLTLSVEQIIEYYGARWKIESGFKELKQEIGSSKSQTRNHNAVTNHLHFCAMSAAITWLYAERLEHTPQRSHPVIGRKHFAFSDVRKLITQAALDKDFDRVFPKPVKPAYNSFIQALMRMVA
jgi:hypothetical protein